jgi:5-methylcytosine-specific restriction endonuclease McrA
VRRYRQAHPEKGRESARRYRQAHPEQQREQRRQYLVANSEKEREYGRRYRQAHPEKVSERHRRYRLTNPGKNRLKQQKRRALKRGVLTEPINPDTIYLRDKGVCQICHKKVSRSEASLDHIIPLKNRGPHTMANLQLTHRRCNFRRGAGRLPAQQRLAL